MDELVYNSSVHVERKLGSKQKKVGAWRTEEQMSDGEWEEESDVKDEMKKWKTDYQMRWRTVHEEEKEIDARGCLYNNLIKF